MLQYALPQPQHFSKPPSTFASSTAKPARETLDYRSSSLPDGLPRPASKASAYSTEPSQQQSFGGAVKSENSLSGLSALESLAATAANAPAASMNPAQQNEHSPRSSTSNSTAMSQTAPAATAGYGIQQNGQAPPVCANCSTSTTPLWRRDESGSVLCNACGLFLKLHGRPRPISLKTDVIKSRNRVKTSQSKKRDSNGEIHPQHSYPAAHPQDAHAHPHHAAVPGHQHGLPTGSIAGQDQHAHQRAPSPNSLHRSDTPGNPNIAPQHIFDIVSLPSDTFASPNLPHFSFRQPSPAPTLNGSSQAPQSQSHEDLIQQNNALRTRVSELEVINDLFRGRVSELESHEQNSRDKERSIGDDTQRLIADLATANTRVAELERKVKELEEEEGPARKKARAEGESDAEAPVESNGVQH